MPSSNFHPARPSVAAATYSSARAAMRTGLVFRMVSPSDVGKMIKPFVFLDLVDTQEAIG